MENLIPVRTTIQKLRNSNLVKTIEDREFEQRNEHGVGYVDYQFLIEGATVFSYRQRNDFGISPNWVKIKVPERIAIDLVNDGSGYMEQATERAIRKKINNNTK